VSDGQEGTATHDAQGTFSTFRRKEFLMATKPSIVLVHGAWADGTGWEKVIPPLEKKGFSVTAVQLPLKALAEDVATAKRAIEMQKGDVVLVGHSYGGAVITGAAANNPKIKALVYVAAFAPEVGETLQGLLGKFPATKLASSIAPDSAGYLYIDRNKFHDAFAHDVSPEEGSVMAAAQKPLAGAIFGETLQTTASRNIPSWYIVAKQDNAIPPDLERFFGKRLGATVTEVESSHVPYVSRPEDVIRVIETAASKAVASKAA
jgi:pimeloyl-ACP methyl ester carboxylesterase